jgi:N-succinyldiaminopimelate aminotransferase
VLPVNGSREALFAFAQVAIDATRPDATVVCPNPFYQIYEGAALLAGAGTAFANSDPARNFAPDWSQLDAATWARTQLLYVCSPGNPTGAVMPLSEWRELFELSDRHGFVIASDECYSEIYFGEAARWADCRRPRRWAATTTATWWPSPACPSARTCRGCAPASSPATRAG